MDERVFVVNKMKKIDGKKVGKVGKERSTTYVLEAMDSDTGDRLVLKSESSLESDFDLKDQVVLRAVATGKQEKIIEDDE